ncbi:hypothetical protein C1645_819764, partial [Glomus cerebriforme]
MPRSDKKDTTCVCCGYKFTRLAKLRQHYQSNKNQCSPTSTQKEKKTTTPKTSNIPRLQSPSPAPISHIRGRDRRKEVLRKPGEHLRTWGARLRRRWIEVTGEECILPKTLKECQRLHHDLLQADDEASENNQEDPEAGPGPATQANRKKQRKIV